MAAILAAGGLAFGLLMTALGAAQGEQAASWKNGLPGQPVDDGVTTLAENSRFTLQLNKQTVQIEGKSGKSTLYSLDILDKESAFTYSTAVDRSYYGAQEETSKVLLDGLSKLFSVSITDFGTKNEVLHTSAADTQFQYETLADGAKLYIYFPSRSVGLTAEFRISEDGLSVRVPEDGLVEDDKYAIVSVDALPMFGAVRSGDDGYIFYPDGSGAVYEIPEQAGKEKLVSADVYSPSDMKMQTFLDNEEQGISNVMLPVFGIRREDHAVMGFITEGAEYAQINLAPNGHMYKGLNRVYPTFRYRKSFQYVTTNDIETYSVEKDRRLGDVALEYRFLSGEEASYSGMAAVYRDWLLAEGRLVPSGDAGDFRILLTFLGGAKVDALFGESLEKASTFDGIDRAMDTLSAGDRDAFTLNLLGWQKHGYNAYPAHLPIASALGGSGGLRALTDAMREKNIPVYLTDNFVWVNADGAGKESGKVIYTYLNVPVSDEQNIYYLLNPCKVDKDIAKVLAAVTEAGGSLLFEDYGGMLYEDYSRKNSITRTEMAAAVAENLQKADAAGGRTGVSGGNAYVLAHADLLTDLPMRSSGRFLFDYDVPFYQMVVYGSIPYAAELPGNMATDLQTERLRWLETGSMPYFLLTTEPDCRMQDTVYNVLFGSYYENWTPEIQAIYDEYHSGPLTAVCGTKMQRHERLSEVLRRITYENGTVLLLNYGEQEAQVSGTVVPAKGYTVLAG